MLDVLVIAYNKLCCIIGVLQTATESPTSFHSFDLPWNAVVVILYTIDYHTARYTLHFFEVRIEYNFTFYVIGLLVYIGPLINGLRRILTNQK